jgi:uncharacterized membrane protein HdeD (DUF308 family)
MSAVLPTPIAIAQRPAAAGLRRRAGWLFALGSVQVVAGFFATSFSFGSIMASVATLGVLLLFASGAQAAAAIVAPTWRAFILFLVLEVIYNVAGLLSLAGVSIPGAFVGIDLITSGVALFVLTVDADTALTT